MRRRKLAILERVAGREPLDAERQLAGGRRRGVDATALADLEIDEPFQPVGPRV